jgi:trypsin-like peptidase
MRLALCLLSVNLLLAGGRRASTQDGGVEERAKRQTAAISAICDSGASNFGAGIVVGEDKEFIYVLTRYHVLRRGGCNSGTVRFYRSEVQISREMVFEMVAQSAPDDLAALRVSKTGDKNFGFRFTFNLARDPKTLRRGDHLFAVGNRNSQEPWYVPPEPLFFAGGSGFQIGPGLSLQPGMSGGPICNADGEIVAIAEETGDSPSKAMPITEALSIFNSWKGVPAARLFAERRFPVMKPQYTEIGADAEFPSFTGGLAADGPGASLHIAHGITRLLTATFDASVLYGKRTSLEYIGTARQPVVETRQSFIPTGGLQLQPFSDFARKGVHETLGGFYVGGALGWDVVARSVHGPIVSVNENLSSLVMTTEAGYRWPLRRRGWGLKVSYRVYQPLRSEGLDRSYSFGLGMYGIFR